MEAGVGATLIIGSTGFIGRFVAEACLDSGLQTYILLRPGPASSSKSSTISFLHDKGALLLSGSMNDQDLMEKILRDKKIEYVISTVGGGSVADQVVLVKAIQAVGTVKRFLPSEFGHDMDRADPVEPGLTMYNQKRTVRRSIEQAAIPYTYVCCNSIAAWPYHDNTHPAEVLPPLDCFRIYGDGTVKAYFVDGADIGRFTVKSMGDERTANKTLHFQPRRNLLCMNELAALWESKLGYKLPRLTVTEDHLLAAAKEMPIPASIVAAITHDIFIKGCQTNFELDKPTDVEASALYPDLPFRPIDECFDDFIRNVPSPNIAVAGDLPIDRAIMVHDTKPETLVITA